MDGLEGWNDVLVRIRFEPTTIRVCGQLMLCLQRLKMMSKRLTIPPC